MYINPINILIFLFVVIVLFVLFREVVTWYWKLNHIVRTLDGIDANLTYIAEILEAKNPDAVKKVNNNSDQEAHDAELS
jgi:hypothetical protein